MKIRIVDSVPTNAIRHRSELTARLYAEAVNQLSTPPMHAEVLKLAGAETFWTISTRTKG